MFPRAVCDFASDADDEAHEGGEAVGLPGGDALGADAGVHPLLGDDRLLVAAGDLNWRGMGKRQNIRVGRWAGGGSLEGERARRTEHLTPKTDSDTQ